MAYASQKLSNDFLRKNLKKIEILKQEKNLKDDDYLLLTSVVREEEIMDVTQGNDELLTAHTVHELNEIVRKRVARDETLKFIRGEADEKRKKWRIFFMAVSIILSVIAFICIFYYNNLIVNIIFNAIAWGGLLFGFVFIKWFDKIATLIAQKYYERKTHMQKEENDY